MLGTESLHQLDVHGLVTVCSEDAKMSLAPARQTNHYQPSNLLNQVKQHQGEILGFLDSKKIKYFTVDISTSNDAKEQMRKKVGNPSAMPPQVFNGDKYCGDYQKFFDAVEEGKPEAFFKL
ncbi:uncharacterized protein LOC751696 isoform 1 [Danio rerio]|uniref:Uncharacterized protein LOC751696 isoform 1 n=1 Tax=Danio rerio TaxID=7955 RepID=A0A8M1P0S2_DANRE|nr:uncharacterized protein LOC751696 isoform 1 [Danio rerio]|eukprot:NP_001278865.1 SH3 domain-binding glutamic acid-rich-like protein 3 isoform 1 [Danio rerio]